MFSARCWANSMEEGRRLTQCSRYMFPSKVIILFVCFTRRAGGGALCEWFAFTPAGQRVLLNDASQGANALHAYLTAASSPICVSGVIPVNGATGVGPDSDITAFVVDGNPVQVASVQMWVNGAPVNVSTTHTNSLTIAAALNTGTPFPEPRIPRQLFTPTTPRRRIATRIPGNLWWPPLRGRLVMSP